MLIFDLELNIAVRLIRDILMAAETYWTRYYLLYNLLLLLQRLEWVLLVGLKILYRLLECELLGLLIWLLQAFVFITGLLILWKFPKFRHRGLSSILLIYKVIWCWYFSLTSFPVTITFSDQYLLVCAHVSLQERTLAIISIYSRVFMSWWLEIFEKAVLSDFLHWRFILFIGK